MDCRGCLHWLPLDEAERRVVAHPRLRIGDALTAEDAPGEWGVCGMPGFMGVEPGGRAFLADGAGRIAQLATRSDFACASWCPVGAGCRV